MKTYNRAIDYTVLALSELQNGKPVLAARLLAKASEQTDLGAAIQLLEANNKMAFKNQIQAAAKAKSRLRANEEENCDDEEVEAEMEDEGQDFEADPLEEVADAEPVMEDEEMEENPAAEMAAVLSKMKRRAK